MTSLPSGDCGIIENAKKSVVGKIGLSTLLSKLLVICMVADRIIEFECNFRHSTMISTPIRNLAAIYLYQVEYIEIYSVNTST